MTVVLTHECGFRKEMNFMCPKCGLPFCDEDAEQVSGGVIIGHVNNQADIEQLRKDNKLLSERVTKLEKRVYSCNACMHPADSDIQPIVEEEIIT